MLAYCEARKFTVADRDGTVLCFYESGDPDNPRKHGRRWAYSFLTLARFHPD